MRISVIFVKSSQGFEHSYFVRKIYVQKFFQTTDLSVLPRPSVPPQSVATVESLLKYLRMQHAQSTSILRFTV